MGAYVSVVTVTASVASSNNSDEMVVKTSSYFVEQGKSYSSLFILLKFPVLILNGGGKVLNRAYAKKR